MTKHKDPLRSKGPHKLRFTPLQVKQYGLVGLLLGFVLQIFVFPPISYTFCTILRIIFISCTIGYLPSYLDNSEYTSLGKVSHHRDNPNIGRWFFPSKDVFLKFEDGPKPDPQKQYIVLLSPHGCLSFTHWALNTCELTPHFGPKRRSLGGDVIFKIPFYREVMLAGGLVSADARTCEDCLENGYTIVVMPGGIIEQVQTKHGEQAVYIKHRRGIFRYALKYNIPIIPIYAMNEVNLCKTSDFLQDFRNYLAKKWWFPVFFCSPFIDKSKIPAYGGKPISLTIEGNEPTEKEVDMIQQLYIDEIQRVYANHRKEWGIEQEEIKIR